MIPEDGTYRVGVDVQPGTYKTDGPAGDFGICTWWRLNSLSGSNDAITNIGNEMGSAFITIDPGDVAFKTQACLPWRKVSG